MASRDQIAAINFASDPTSQVEEPTSPSIGLPGLDSAAHSEDGSDDAAHTITSNLLQRDDELIFSGRKPAPIGTGLTRTREEIDEDSRQERESRDRERVANRAELLSKQGLEKATEVETARHPDPLDSAGMESDEDDNSLFVRGEGEVTDKSIWEDDRRPSLGIASSRGEVFERGQRCTGFGAGVQRFNDDSHNENWPFMTLEESSGAARRKPMRTHDEGEMKSKLQDGLRHSWGIAVSRGVSRSIEDCNVRATGFGRASSSHVRETIGQRIIKEKIAREKSEGEAREGEVPLDTKTDDASTKGEGREPWLHQLREDFISFQPFKGVAESREAPIYQRPGAKRGTDKEEYEMWRIKEEEDTEMKKREVETKAKSRYASSFGRRRTATRDAWKDGLPRPSVVAALETKDKRSEPHIRDTSESLQKTAEEVPRSEPQPAAPTFNASEDRSFDEVWDELHAINGWDAKDEWQKKVYRELVTKISTRHAKHSTFYPAGNSSASAAAGIAKSREGNMEWTRCSYGNAESRGDVGERVGGFGRLAPTGVRTSKESSSSSRVVVPMEEVEQVEEKQWIGQERAPSVTGKQRVVSYGSTESRDANDARVGGFGRAGQTWSALSAREEQLDRRSSSQTVPAVQRKTRCSGCRNRKLVCDGMKPSCSRCERNAQNCIYDIERRVSSIHRIKVEKAKEGEAAAADAHERQRRVMVEKGSTDSREYALRCRYEEEKARLERLEREGRDERPEQETSHWTYRTAISSDSRPYYRDTAECRKDDNERVMWYGGQARIGFGRSAWSDGDSEGLGKDHKKLVIRDENEWENAVDSDGRGRGEIVDTQGNVSFESLSEEQQTKFRSHLAPEALLRGTAVSREQSLYARQMERERLETLKALGIPEGRQGRVFQGMTESREIPIYNADKERRSTSIRETDLRREYEGERASFERLHTEEFVAMVKEHKQHNSQYSIGKEHLALGSTCSGFRSSSTYGTTSSDKMVMRGGKEGSYMNHDVVEEDEDDVEANLEGLVLRTRVQVPEAMKQAMESGEEWRRFV